MILEQLQQYKRVTYDLKMLEIEIEELRAQYQLLSEPSYINAVSYDYIPGGGLSDLTGRLAAAVIDGDMVKDLQQIIRGKEYKLSEMLRKIKRIDVWLSSLPERERFVINAHLIEDVPWRLLVYKYKSTYGENVSIDTLKRLQRKALEKG